MSHFHKFIFSEAIFLIFSFLIAPVVGYAQLKGDWIEGELRNSKTGEAVAFATVVVESSKLGVISNVDGHFRIPNRPGFEGERLAISSMGYRTQLVEIASFKPDQTKIIFLDPSAIQLDEAIVTSRFKSLTAREIVSYAIARIKLNFPSEDFKYVGYYRDYQWNKKSYQNLNEALIEVYDKGFRTFDTIYTEFRLLELRRNLDFPIDQFAARPYNYQLFDKIVPSALVGNYNSNEFMLLRVHDPIRNYQLPAFSFVNRFATDFISNHQLGKLADTEYNGTRVFRISIQKKEADIDVKGMLYIDKDDFSIRRFDYEVSRTVPGKQKRESPHYVTGSLNANSPQKLIFKLSVEYREGPKNKMYPNYISFQNRFELLYPPEFRIEQLILDPSLLHVEVQLNKPAANWEELKKSDFKVRYRGKRVKLSKVLQGDSSSYLLKIDQEKVKQRVLIRQLFSKKEDPRKESLNVEIQGLMDHSGNPIGERKRESLVQFREFFVQEIIENYEREVDSEVSLMSKHNSLFDSIQPVVRDTMETSYWMNSPLQSGIID